MNEWHTKFHSKKSFITQRRIKNRKIENRKIYGSSNIRRFKSKRKYNEAMQDLEYHFRLSYREFDEVVPLITLITKAAVEIVNFK